ncbi:hypothetical protein C8024_01685 [Sphingopyxis sp. BSNA05]|uniref:hypothetical protein n=1 Tax=Sphingomonadales TaxID=204457 RepID=UPI000C1E831E|nr:MULTISPECIES: hypothetical protein [Sphingomonadaceae]ATW05125.1 hypothetical protein CHN51_17530 [Sphingorhabdus sp. YGSMI21]NRD88446.1 hypothetical protein [Sphingopyxis sp. BSNA05]
MSRFAAILLPILLAGCGQQQPKAEQADTELPPLEQAAIDAGVIPDVRNVTLSGAFERRSDLGTDRFCAVGNDENGYQIGMIAVFGPETKCEGLGEAEREGETVRITLNSEETCRFSARFDGVELELPGSLPETCSSYCSPRAGFEGVSFYMVGEGDAVARSTSGRDFENLCPGG